MPTYTNVNKLRAELTNCTAQLNTVFASLPVSDVLNRQIGQVNRYYNDLFNKSTAEENGSLVILEYKILIKRLNEVKSGKITRQGALDQIEDSIFDKKIELIIQNFFVAAELLFWAMASLFSFVALTAIGIPMIFSDPLLGLPITYGTTVACKAAYEQGTNCLDNFESCDEINNEATREKNLVSFFKPALPPAVRVLPSNEFYPSLVQG